MANLWRVLFRQGVDVVLNGHEHHYERFAPLSPSGRGAPRRGIRGFVVGTGGAGSYPFGYPIRGSQKRITNGFPTPVGWHGQSRLWWDRREVMAWAKVRTQKAWRCPRKSVVSRA
jgi:hypothetical protein